MPFDYFDSLSDRNKRIYRKSDGVQELPLPEASLEGLRQKARRLRAALASELHRTTEQASRELVRSLCEALSRPAPNVRVHEVRPTGAYGELHGLYTRWPDGRSRLEVWMRTAVNERTVAYRTYLRTLVHEVVHHLDYVLLELEDSFHTEGFFKRESSLVRQLDLAPQDSRRAMRERDLGPVRETHDEKLARLRARLDAQRAPKKTAKSTVTSASVTASSVTAASVTASSSATDATPPTSTTNPTSTTTPSTSTPGDAAATVTPRKRKRATEASPKRRKSTTTEATGSSVETDEASTTAPEASATAPEASTMAPEASATLASEVPPPDLASASATVEASESEGAAASDEFDPRVPHRPRRKSRPKDGAASQMDLFFGRD